MFARFQQSEVGLEFFEVVEKRRSVREFSNEAIPDEVIWKALDAATRAPNSSNTQTWNFYWVKSEENRKRMVEACLSQSAARTAAGLMVIVASPKAWRRSQPALIEWAKKSNAHRRVLDYYEKLIPLTYRWGIFNSLGVIKALVAVVVGLFRPMPRGPSFRRDIQEVSIKSAALAAENFVLALTAQGYSTCMMEGFDEARVKRILKLNCSDRVVMVIGMGRGLPKGIWGPQFRLPLKDVVHEL